MSKEYSASLFAQDVVNALQKRNIPVNGKLLDDIKAISSSFYDNAFAEGEESMKYEIQKRLDF